METKYLPVDPYFFDLIESFKSMNKDVVIHYFGLSNELNQVKGLIEKVIKNNSNQEYLVIKSGENVRLDRIITLNGRPGPAFDEYDGYALACLDCMGGMD
ncbi:MAG: hypothetical protein GX820_07110 [Bacteroidales bacterium]|nr:hypothetical protein [Bacteroidales bacterium]